MSDNYYFSELPLFDKQIFINLNIIIENVFAF